MAVIPILLTAVPLKENQISISDCNSQLLYLTANIKISIYLVFISIHNISLSRYAPLIATCLLKYTNTQKIHKFVHKFIRVRPYIFSIKVDETLAINFSSVSNLLATEAAAFPIIPKKIPLTHMIYKKVSLLFVKLLNMSPILIS